MFKLTNLKAIKLILALCAIFSIGTMSAEDSLNFRVTRNDYTFSTLFDFTSNGQPIGTVNKSSFHVRTHYDLYSPNGEFEAQGICRMFCLGSIYVWGTEIDVYDGQGGYLGMIDGQFLTGESAKFSLYDAEGNRLAIAYLNFFCNGFSILSESTGGQVAKLQRVYALANPGHWDVTINDTSLVPVKLIEIFAAFACDQQQAFLKIFNDAMAD